MRYRFADFWGSEAMCNPSPPPNQNKKTLQTLLREEVHRLDLWIDFHYNSVCESESERESNKAGKHVQNATQFPNLFAVCALNSNANTVSSRKDLGESMSLLFLKKYWTACCCMFAAASQLLCTFSSALLLQTLNIGTWQNQPPGLMSHVAYKHTEQSFIWKVLDCLLLSSLRTLALQTACTGVAKKGLWSSWDYSDYLWA